MDLSYEIALGKIDEVDGFKVFGWLSKKSTEIFRLLGATKRIIDVALQEALGPPGVAGDAEAIVYVAEKLGSLYRECIEWAIDFQRVRVDEDFERVIRLTSNLTGDMLKGIDQFSIDIKATFDDLITNPPLPGEKRTLDLTLKVDVPDMSEVYAELGTLREKYGLVDE